MIIDIHSHTPTDADITVINFYPYEQIPNKGENDLLSAGLHPWFTPTLDIDKSIQQLEYLCKNKLIQCIGECGLDKNVDDLNLQESIFKQHIELSNKYKLPIVIHAVKTHHLLLKIRKETGYEQPWIIHGFQGKIETVKQFEKQNIFISFGVKLLEQPQKFKLLINQVDKDFILFETDDSDVDIKQIYVAAAEMLNLSLGELEQQIAFNFKRLFR